MKMTDALRDWHHQLSERKRLPPLIADIPRNKDFAAWLDAADDKALFDTPISENVPAARCVLYLWNGSLEQAHTIAQQMPTALGSYLHGIMHRREPDYWNSKQWFRKAGELPIFPELFQEFADLRTAYVTDVPSTLKKLTSWNPIEYVDNCEKRELDLTTPRHRFLQRIQQIELQCLWEFVLKGELVAD